MIELPQLDASSYRSHPLHAETCDWPETNCYVDLWVELLHALGLDPVAAMGFVLRTDFDGEQWEFFKYPLEDLWTVYGIHVREMNAWRPLAEHIVRHRKSGKLLTIEVDSWFLPDTAGVSYQIEHQKSSIVPLEIDPDHRRLSYFHNRGYYVLEGEDYDGALQTSRSPQTLPPYVELIDLSRAVARPDTEIRSIVDELVVGHLERRPASNAIARLTTQILEDLPWLRDQPPEAFHQYAFGSLRQCGAWAACAAAFSRWLDHEGVEEAALGFDDISQLSKTAQFQLARAARGRGVDFSDTFGAMTAAWDRSYEVLSEIYKV